MIIQEIELTHPTHDRAAKVHVIIDGIEYMMLGCKASVTVLNGRWCHDRRALGKTFFAPADLAGHYRKHGEELVRYANRITTWGE